MSTRQIQPRISAEDDHHELILSTGFTRDLGWDPDRWMPEMMASASARSRPSGARSAAPLTFAGIVSIILGRAAAELVDVC